MTSIHIKASREYDVIIDRGLINRVGEYANKLIKGRTACIVTDDNVYPLYEKRVRLSLEKAGFKVLTYTIPHGEHSKSINVYEKLLEYLLEERLTRSDVLIALGGGVVGDLTGFAAATYQRGIQFIQVPTTLLAMVDSSVGGKTAVNLTNGKNQVGAFYQPSAVICDPDTLKTLPHEEYLCGCAEVIKYAVFGNADFFKQLDNTPASEQLENVITTCVEMKRDVVAADEFDTGKRMILNFGHTIGHAVEACSDFSILHGQGVAIGMAVISRAANKMGMLSEADLNAIVSLLEKYELPTTADFPLEDMYNAALADKKVAGSSITIVVPEKVGSCRLLKIPKEELKDWMTAGGIA